MPALVERDWLRQANAHELARRIEAFWAREAPPGHQAAVCSVELAPHGDSPRDVQRAVGYVRSNLIGGLPPRAGGAG